MQHNVDVWPKHLDGLGELVLDDHCIDVEADPGGWEDKAVDRSVVELA